MSNRNLTNTTRLKARELLRRLRTRFPALFPAVRGVLKPWALGEGYRLRQALAEAEDGEEVSNQVGVGCGKGRNDTLRANQRLFYQRAG